MGEAVPLAVTLPGAVAVPPAPAEGELEGDGEVVEEGESVSPGEGVGRGVGVVLGVGQELGEALDVGVWESGAVAVAHVLGEAEASPETVAVEVGGPVAVMVPEAVSEGCAAVAVRAALGVAAALPGVGTPDTLALALEEMLPRALLTDAPALALMSAVGVRVGLPVAHDEAEGVGVEHAVPLMLALLDSVVDAVPPAREAELVLEYTPELLGEREALAERLSEVEAEGEARGPDADGVREALLQGLALRLVQALADIELL